MRIYPVAPRSCGEEIRRGGFAKSQNESELHRIPSARGERITSSTALQLDDDRLGATRNEGEIDATKARPQRRDDPERRSGFERGFPTLSDFGPRGGAA